jgi:hypothetical protein
LKIQSRRRWKNTGLRSNHRRCLSGGGNIAATAILFIGKGIRYNIFFLNVGKVSILIHEIELRVDIIIDDTIEIQIHLEFRHLEFLFLGDESIGIDLEARFGVGGELLVFEDLVFFDLLKLFFFVFFLKLDCVGHHFVFAIGVDVGVEQDQRVDILEAVGDAAEGLHFAA